MKNDFPFPPKGQEKKIAFNYTPPLKSLNFHVLIIALAKTFFIFGQFL